MNANVIPKDRSRTRNALTNHRKCPRKLLTVLGHANYMCVEWRYEECSTDLLCWCILRDNILLMRGTTRHATRRMSRRPSECGQEWVIFGSAEAHRTHCWESTRRVRCLSVWWKRLQCIFLTSHTLAVFKMNHTFLKSYSDTYKLLGRVSVCVYTTIHRTVSVQNWAVISANAAKTASN